MSPTNNESRVSLADADYIVRGVTDLTNDQVSAAVRVIRETLAKRNYDEILLSPIDRFPIEYRDAIDVPGLGQLRFNTEPEIWSLENKKSQFYSISALFRAERNINALRKQCFQIVDYYRECPPSVLLEEFFDLLFVLQSHDHIRDLAKLRCVEAKYNSALGAPDYFAQEPTWVLATSYGIDDSLYEVDLSGVSTRNELFLVTPKGYLEIAALGFIGRNANANYRLKTESELPYRERSNTSGLGFGLERLLLAPQLIYL